MGEFDHLQQGANPGEDAGVGHGRNSRQWIFEAASLHLRPVADKAFFQPRVLLGAALTMGEAAPLPFFFARSGCRASVDLFQRHAATTLTRLGRHGVAGAGTPAVAKVKSGPLEADPFDRLAAAAFGRVGGIDGAGALGAAGAEQGFVPFDLDQMVMVVPLLANMEDI
jgi:hypothetical protein